MVALALIIKRYTLPEAKASLLPASKRYTKYGLIFLLVCSATALGVAYNLETERWWIYLVLIGVHLLLTVALHALVDQGPIPDYTAPLFPYVPSASLLINAWLCSTLPGSAWIQYAIFLVIVTVIYFAYSVASSLALEEHSALRKNLDELRSDVSAVNKSLGSVVGGRRPSSIVGVIAQTEDGELMQVTQDGQRVEMPADGVFPDEVEDAKPLEGSKAVEMV